MRARKGPAAWERLATATQAVSCHQRLWRADVEAMAPDRGKAIESGAVFFGIVFAVIAVVAVAVAHGFIHLIENQTEDVGS